MEFCILREVKGMNIKMNKKELSLHEPLISTYTSYGAIFSIINEEESAEWLYNNFIQLRYGYNWGIITFDMHEYLMSNCPNLNLYTYPMELLQKKYDGSLFRFIREAIDMDYYVFMYVDRFYMPFYNHYQKAHMGHEVFISGYDLEKRTVTISDNMYDGKYMTEKCPIDILEEAYHKLNKEYQFMADLRMIRYVPGNRQHFDIAKVKYELQRYLNSVPTYNLIQDQPYIFGMNVYKKVLEFMDEWDKKGEVYQFRVFHMLWEHSMLMERRIAYMEKNNYIRAESVFSERRKEIVEKFLIMRNLVIKKSLIQNEERNRKIGNRIRIILQEVVELEKHFLIDLIQVLNAE